MKLINTDGMALIGPGSEWFWTALSGIVLAVTFLAIYRQLAMARSANSREQLDSFRREWNGERMIRYALAVLVAVRNGADRASLPRGSTMALADFWQGIGALARSGHLDRKVLYETYGSECQSWWAFLAPTLRRWRAEYPDPRFYDHFEWLAGFMAELDRRAGVAPSTLDGPELAHFLKDVIAICEEQLRVEESLRSVTVASPDALPVVGLP